MAIKRPNHASREPVIRRPTRWEPAYWATRVFQQRYSYRGVLRETRGWYVKLQVRGQRRTVPLSATSPAAAAVQACELFRKVISDGWSPATGVSAPPGVTDGHVTMGPALWKDRLVRRKYIDAARGRSTVEWSAGLMLKEHLWHFPLGTELPDEAAQRAAERQRSFRELGWKTASLFFEREVTLGLFWSHNPFGCTYTTLITFPANASSPEPPPGDRNQPTILLVEDDPGVRRALRYWLPRQEHVSWRVQCCTGTDLHAQFAGSPPHLILVNHANDAPAGRALLAELQEQHPDAPVLGYGVYPDSDEMFRSLSGISAGYLMRRRPPAALLDPLTRFDAVSNLTLTRLHQLVRRYFFSVFAEGETTEAPGTEAPLTPREREILALMSEGLQHKEIASHLQISIFTVQSHARVIFEKLGVHSRTEAVVKYLRL